MITIIPSIASADQLRLSDELARLKDTPFLHIDIEDGNFLPNITFGMKTIRAVTNATAAATDAHLLVTNPSNYLEPLSRCGVGRVCFHIEAAPYPADLLNRIRRCGMKAGLAFNFKTSVREAIPFLSSLDYVLIMTSEPDDGECLFCEAILEKIREARALLPPHISIWVDGGVGEAQLPLVTEAGADTIIMGRAVWQAADPAAQIRRLEAMY